MEPGGRRRRLASADVEARQKAEAEEISGEI
jgi:hypothetical protein